MKITRQFLESLEPCKDRWENYLKYYRDWSGSLSEAMDLEHVSDEDKIWFFTRNIKELEKLQREFAFICAARAVESGNCQEVKDFFALVVLQYEAGILFEYNEDYTAAYWAAALAADSAAGRAAYRAAYWAAYRASYRAADLAACRAADLVAYRASYRAAYQAAERKTQVEIIKYLLRGVK
jgi:hypothetical protein